MTADVCGLAGCSSKSIVSALGKWLVQLPRGHKVIQADGKMGRHPASLNGAKEGNQEAERFCFFTGALQESDLGHVICVDLFQWKIPAQQVLQ